MIQQQVREDFKAALVRALSPGESLISMVDAYTESWGQVWVPAPINMWKDAFQGFNWFSIALTNINFRSFAFRVETHRTGIFKNEHSVVPELVNMSAVPLMNVSSFGSRTFKPVRVVQKALKKTLGTDAGEVMAITVQFPNGYLDCASPYSEIKQIAESFQAAMSGAALAARTTSLADAVTRLADLRSEGVLTEDEFDRAKGGFVGAPVEVGESAASVLRQLHSLQKAGVLTESEFRMKKWDVLSRPT